jgi:hypothetical protein
MYPELGSLPTPPTALLLDHLVARTNDADPPVIL